MFGFAACLLLWCGLMVWLQHLRLAAGVHFEYEDDALYLQLLDFVGDGFVPHNTIHPLHRPSHLTPAYFALWPLYAALGGGWTAVFFIKALFIGGAAIPVLTFARRREHPTLGLALAVIWLLCGPTLALVQSTVRPLTLAAGPLMATVLSYADHRFRATMGWAVVVLTFREDLGLTVGLLSGLALLERRDWRWIVGPGAVAAIWLVVSTQLILPAILPADYGSVVLTTNLAQGSLLDRLLEPSHLGALLAVLAGFALFPLRSRLTLLGAVGVAAIVLNRHALTGNLIHLAMPFVVAAYAGAVVFVLDRDSTRRALLLAACALALHVQPFIPPTVHLPAEIQDATEAESIVAWSPIHPAHYSVSERDRERHTALSEVPAQAAVTAVGHLLPALVPRDRVYEYGHGYVDFTTAEWAVLEATNVSTGAGGHIMLTPAELEVHLDLLQSAGWKVMHQSASGIVVLRRSGPPRAGLADRLRQSISARTAPDPNATAGERALPGRQVAPPR